MKRYEFVASRTDCTSIVASDITDAKMRYINQTGKDPQKCLIYLVIKELIHDGYANPQNLQSETEIESGRLTDFLVRDPD